MIRERALFIIKPDVASTPEHVNAILVRVIAANLQPVALQCSTITAAQAERLYDGHQGKSYHVRNVEFVTSGPSVQVVLEGERACERLRELIGLTDPNEARKIELFTMRSLYGTNLPCNAVHGSASAREAEREIGIFFPVSLQPVYRGK